MIDGFDGLHEGLPDPHGGAHGDAHHDPHGDHHHMYLPLAGEMIDLGTDLIDTDHDGFGDTASFRGPDGLTVVADTHETGVADRVTTFGNDGTYQTWARSEGSQEWVLIEHGRVGSK